MPRLGADASVYLFDKADNMRPRRDVMDLISTTLTMPLAYVAIGGLMFNTVMIAIFALLFYACGVSCYVVGEQHERFSFETMFWLSAQTYTTVGYGSISPACNAGQVVVVLEQYTALLLSLVLSAIILTKVMKARARIRFASVLCVTVEEDHDAIDRARIVVRVANGSRYTVEHITAQMRVMLDGEKIKRLKKAGFSPQVQLPLLAEGRARMESGEHWVLTHNLNCKSPLVEVGTLDANNDGVLDEEELKEATNCVAWIDLMLTCFDPVYGQDVRFNHRYHPQDIVTYSKYRDMLRIEPLGIIDGRRHIRVINDHAFIDDIIEREPPPSPTKHRASTADDATSFTTRAGACIGQITTALTPSKVGARGGAELV